MTRITMSLKFALFGRIVVYFMIGAGCRWAGARVPRAGPTVFVMIYYPPSFLTVNAGTFLEKRSEKPGLQ